MGRIAVFLVALVLASPAWAAGMVHIRGAGATSCGTWTSERQINEFSELHDSPLRQPLFRESWVLGYMSGHITASDVDFFKASDVDGIFAAMDQECAKTPLDDIYEAADRVMLQLIARMPPATKN